MDSFFDHVFNMPLEEKKAFEDQQKALNALLETITIQQNTITTLTAITSKQTKSINALLGETKKQGKRSSRIGFLSLVFSILAVLFAGLAVWFSLQDFNSDKVWQQEQTEILEQIKESIHTNF